MVLIYRVALGFPERSFPEKTEKHLKTGRSFSGLFKKKEASDALILTRYSPIKSNT